MGNTTEGFENPYNLFAISDRANNGTYKIYSISRKTMEVEPSNFFGKDAIFTSVQEAKQNFENMRDWVNNIGCKRYKDAQLTDYGTLLDVSRRL